MAEGVNPGAVSQSAFVGVVNQYRGFLLHVIGMLITMMQQLAVRTV
jgi:hypothetical protein